MAATHTFFSGTNHYRKQMELRGLQRERCATQVLIHLTEAMKMLHCAFHLRDQARFSEGAKS